jgi:hypothetical protein
VVGMVAVQYLGEEWFERAMEERGLGWLLRV